MTISATPTGQEQPQLTSRYSSRYFNVAMVTMAALMFVIAKNISSHGLVLIDHPSAWLIAFATAILFYFYPQHVSIEEDVGEVDGWLLRKSSFVAWVCCLLVFIISRTTPIGDIIEKPLYATAGREESSLFDNIYFIYFCVTAIYVTISHITVTLFLWIRLSGKNLLDGLNVFNHGVNIFNFVILYLAFFLTVFAI